jgi:hypothetical protein
MLPTLTLLPILTLKGTPTGKLLEQLSEQFSPMRVFDPILIGCESPFRLAPNEIAELDPINTSPIMLQFAEMYEFTSISGIES